MGRLVRVGVARRTREFGRTIITQAVIRVAEVRLCVCVFAQDGMAVSTTRPTISQLDKY